VIDRGSIKAAADEVVTAALLGKGWDEALVRFAHAAGARDAVLMRNTARAMVVAVATEEAAETVAAFAAGRAPPNSRYARVKVDPAGGFRIDHDDYTGDQLARDPFYQEFLRPAGVFWHANAILVAGQDEHVELSLKRRARLDAYQRSDIAVLDTVLPELRAAARVARGTLDAEARGMARLLAHRGGRIVAFDGWGRLVAGQSFGETDPVAPARPVGRRLVALHAAEQPGLEHAIAAALASPGRMALAPLTGPDGRRYVLQVHPIPNRARDVFLAAAAVAVLIERDGQPAALRIDPSALRVLFGFTDREADVASLLAEGLDLPAIARLLRISPGTTRTHLKSVFGKAGVSRQAELVALIARLRP